MFKKYAKKNSTHSVSWIALSIFAAIFLTLFFIINLTNLSSVIDKFNAIMTPIYIGLVIAYLMNPIFKVFENKVFRWKKDTPGKRHACRTLSLFCTLMAFFAIIALLILLIVPQLIESIVEIVTNHEHYIQTVVGFVNDIANSVAGKFTGGEYQEFLSYDSIHQYIHSVLSGGDHNNGNSLADFFEKYSQEITTIGTDVALGIFNFLKNFIIGIFIAFYILASKELRGAQVKKMRKALFTREHNKFISEVIYITKTSFGGYIRGKLLSSLAVGILTFIFLLIFNISDYKVLIATIICVTDIIPVFGPFLGAIPSAIIVLMCDPTKLLPFVIIILLIQLIEGNVITPKILGESTNISSLAVIIAISTMGSIFGVIGMIIGVPVFATIIIIVKRYLEKRLKEKELPTETNDYLAENSMSDIDIILHNPETTWMYKIKTSIKERKEKRAKKKNPDSAAFEESTNTEAEPVTEEAVQVTAEEQAK